MYNLANVDFKKIIYMNVGGVFENVSELQTLLCGSTIVMIVNYSSKNCYT